MTILSKMAIVTILFMSSLPIVSSAQEENDEFIDQFFVDRSISLSDKYFPTINPETEKLIGKESSDPIQNAIRTIHDAYLMGDPNDEYLLEQVVRLADQENNFDWKEVPELSQLLNPANNYLFLKKVFLKDLSQNTRANSMTFQILMTLRNQKVGDNILIDPISFPTKKVWNEGWNQKSHAEKYAYLSNLQTILYHGAMVHAQRKVALLSMYLSKDPDKDTWKDRAYFDLTKQFCHRTYQPKHQNTDNPAINVKLTSGSTNDCEKISERVVRDIREWVPLDTAVQLILKHLRRLNDPIQNLQDQKSKMAGKVFYENNDYYIQYLARYGMTIGPSIAILTGPLKKMVGGFKTIDDINQPILQTHWVPISGTDLDSADRYKQFIIAVQQSLEATRSEIIKSYAEMYEDYHIKTEDEVMDGISGNPLKDSVKVSGYLLETRVAAREKDIRNLIRNYPVVVGQLMSHYPQIVYLIQEQTQAAVQKGIVKDKVHNAVVWTVTAVGILLMIFALGMSGGTAAPLLALIVGYVSLGLGVADFSTSTLYLGEKLAQYKAYERSMMAGTANDATSLKRLHDQRLDAATAKAWATGGFILSFLEVPGIIHAAKAIKVAKVSNGIRALDQIDDVTSIYNIMSTEPAIKSKPSRFESTDISIVKQNDAGPTIKRKKGFIAAGSSKEPITPENIKINSEFVQAQQKIEKKFGNDFQLLHIKDGDGVIINPKGELQNIFVHGNDVELENIIKRKKIENIEWNHEGTAIIKTTLLEDGTLVRVMNDTNLIHVSLADGTKIVTQYDENLYKYLSHFMTSTNDQGMKIAEGFIYRSDDKIVLIQMDGRVFKGERVGSDIIFSNLRDKVYFSVSDQKIFDIESKRWGKANVWQRVTMKGETSDVSEFDLPTLQDDGIATGYGEINCSGLSCSADAWLSKAPLTNALPDSHYTDIVRKEATLEEVIGKSSTVTPENAAEYYNSVSETFDDYTSVHGRLMKMEDGGTALVYVKNFDGSRHVLNARKEGVQVVYYDFQARTVSTDPQAQFFYSNNHKIDIVETTQYHH